MFLTCSIAVVVVCAHSTTSEDRQDQPSGGAMCLMQPGPAFIKALLMKLK